MHFVWEIKEEEKENKWSLCNQDDNDDNDDDVWMLCISNVQTQKKKQQTGITSSEVFSAMTSCGLVFDGIIENRKK